MDFLHTDASEPIPPDCPLCGHLHYGHERCEDCDCNPLGMTLVDPADWQSWAIMSTPLLVPPFVAGEGVTILSGTTNTGKSHVLMDIALHLATGLAEWHGYEIGPFHGSVLMVDAENSRPVIGKRIGAWLDAYGMAPDTDLSRFVPGIDTEFALGQQGPDVIGFLERVKGAEAAHVAMGGSPFGLIIVDNLQMMSGSEDANSEAGVRPVVQELKFVSRELGIPSLLAAHPNKEAGRKVNAMMVNGMRPDPADTVSGSMIVVNATYATAVMGQGKDRAFLAVPKVRDAIRPSDVWEVHLEHMNLDVFGQPVAGSVIRPGEFPVRKPREDHFGAFVAWVEEFGEGDWVVVADATPDNDAPVSERTARKYLKDDKHADQRKVHSLQVREEPGGRKGGKPRLLCRVGAADGDA